MKKLALLALILLSGCSSSATLQNSLPEDSSLSDYTNKPTGAIPIYESNPALMDTITILNDSNTILFEKEPDTPEIDEDTSFYRDYDESIIIQPKDSDNQYYATMETRDDRNSITIEATIPKDNIEDFTSSFFPYVESIDGKCSEHNKGSVNCTIDCLNRTINNPDEDGFFMDSFTKSKWWGKGFSFVDFKGEPTEDNPNFYDVEVYLSNYKKEFYDSWKNRL